MTISAERWGAATEDKSGSGFQRFTPTKTYPTAQVTVIWYNSRHSRMKPVLRYQSTNDWKVVAHDEAVFSTLVFRSGRLALRKTLAQDDGAEEAAGLVLAIIDGLPDVIDAARRERARDAVAHLRVMNGVGQRVRDPDLQDVLALSETDLPPERPGEAVRTAA